MTTAARTATLLSLLITAGAAKPSFNPRNRPALRGILGTRVQLPCMVHNAQYTNVSWVSKGVPLTEGRTVKAADPRLAMRADDDSDTWMLEITPATASDAGRYDCVVTLPGGQQMTKMFTLVIVEPSSEVLWRWDSRCGGDNVLNGSLSHVSAQCDGRGTFPCCSRWGWCGFSPSHCDCYGCQDYSKKPVGLCTTPFTWLQGSEICVTFGPSQVTYEAAEAFCGDLDASLLAYETFNELKEEAKNVIKGRQENTKFWVGLSSVGRISMAEMVEGMFANLLGSGDSTLLETSALCSALSHADGDVQSHDEDCAASHFPVCTKATRANL